jgi:hypothetical protein
MRFQDWDVLLFPAGSHVPVREFRTACFAQQDPRTLAMTPLLTCFVPSLPANAPFQISVHAWNKPTSIVPTDHPRYVPGHEYLWQVKVIADGVTIATETFGADASWPRQLGALFAVHSC